MKQFALVLYFSLCLVLGNTRANPTQFKPKGPNREGRHYFGTNGTLPKTMHNMGTINVAGVGDIYVVTSDPGTFTKLDNGFQLHGGGGVSLATNGGDIGSDPFMYWQVELADHYFSYTVDVSNVGCKCNAAMYFINMPGYENGQPYPADWGVYYCDANFVNGNWCPEYDTFEGNAETMGVAIHTCDYVPPNEYPSCDRSGCGTNACEGIGGQYGRGRTIDTNRPYKLSHASIMDGDFLSTSNQHFEQDGKTAEFNACNNFEAMKWMGYDLHDIVAWFSLWDMGCDESWLDGCTGCGGCCNLGGSSVTWTDFALGHVRDSPNPKVREEWYRLHPEELEA